MAFSAGAIVAKLQLDKSKWSTAINEVKKDQKSLSGFVLRNSANIKKLGRNMTIAGGIVTAGFAAMIKKASEAEETTAKFGTVFADVFPKATSAVDNLTKSYGLSDLAAKTMLSATGDLLTGLGAQSDVALDLSLKTQQLAVDLASFTNYSGGAKGASEALTKAMLGERESIKSLGIVVTEEMVKEELLRTGKDKLTGQALLQAKAYATLSIATNQSKNAIGDYARTSGSFANTMRELRARLEDVITQLGAQLIPIATKLASSLKEVISGVSEWIKKHPKLTEIIVKFTAGIGLLMLAFGPLLMALPNLVKGFSILKGAILKVIPSIKTLKGSIVGVSGALKSIVPVAAAAFIGWNIGRLIGELTGLDGAIQNLSARVLGLGKITGYELTPTLLSEAEAMQKLHELFANHDKSLIALKTKYGSYNEALKAAKEGLEGETTATEVAGKTVADWGSLMRKHGVLTISESSKKVEALKKKQDDLKAAYDAGIISLTEYKKSTKEAKDEIKSLTGITEKATEKTESWKEYLETLGVKTIPEKEKRVKLLKSHLEKLHKEYKEGRLSLEDYVEATNEARDEIEDLSTTIMTTIIPKSRNMADVLDGAVGDMEDRIPDVETAVETTCSNISTHWDNLMTDIGGAFGQFTFDLLSEGSTLSDDLATLWGNIKDSFKAMVAGMVQEWVTGLLKNMVTGTGDAAGSVTEAVGGAAKAVASVGTSLATIIVTLSKAIATSAKTLAEAAPYLLKVAGVAMIIYAGFGLIKGILGKLFAKKDPMAYTNQLLADISWKQLAAVIEKQDVANELRGVLIEKEDAILDQLYIINDKRLLPLLNKTQSVIEGIKKVIAKLSAAPSAQRGRVVTKPGVVMTHGTPREPEIIMPRTELMKIPEVRAGGRATEINLNIRNEFSFNNQVDPNFTRDYVRRVVIPHLFDGLETEARKTKLKEILGVT